MNLTDEEWATIEYVHVKSGPFAYWRIYEERGRFYVNNGDSVFSKTQYLMPDGERIESYKIFQDYDLHIKSLYDTFEAAYENAMKH